MNSGKYLCFEGGDGSGKSTLVAALQDRLGLLSASSTRFPSDGIVGSLIRRGLMGKVSLEYKPFLYLFAADGLQQELWIEDQLDQGKHVLCDRHPMLSGRAFQPKHHSQEQIEAVYGAAWVDGILMPDYLFVVQVSPDEAIRRMANRDKYVDVVFESNKIEELEVINRRYAEICVRFGGYVLDGHRPVDELVEEVLSIAEIG